MALFSRSKKADEAKAEAPKAEAKPAAPKALPTDHNPHGVLLKPHFTEKSVNLGEQNVYTFEVKRAATKHQVVAAVKELYNVTPVKVNIVNKAPAKRTRGFNRQTVAVSGMKKAYVYLKKGDSISLV